MLPIPAPIATAPIVPAPLDLAPINPVLPCVHNCGTSDEPEHKDDKYKNLQPLNAMWENKGSKNREQIGGGSISRKVFFLRDLQGPSILKSQVSIFKSDGQPFSGAIKRVEARDSYCKSQGTPRIKVWIIEFDSEVSETSLRFRIKQSH